MVVSRNELFKVPTEQLADQAMHAIVCWNRGAGVRSPASVSDARSIASRLSDADRSPQAFQPKQNKITLTTTPRPPILSLELLPAALYTSGHAGAPHACRHRFPHASVSVHPSQPACVSVG